MKAFFLLALLLAGPVEAQEAWHAVDLRWRESCQPDQGAISRSGERVTFRPGGNNCNGSFRQRSELRADDIPLRQPGQWLFEATVAMTSASDQAFDILQFHDGIPGCAPPLKLRWLGDGQLGFDGAWTREGAEDACLPNRALREAVYRGPRLTRDGAPHALQVLLAMDGSGGFDVTVQVDGQPALAARYDPPGAGFLRTDTAFLKHGVYARDAFDFVLTSDGLRVLHAD